LIKIKWDGGVVGEGRLAVYGGSSLGDVEAVDVEGFSSVLCVFGSFGWGL